MLIAQRHMPNDRRYLYTTWLACQCAGETAWGIAVAVAMGAIVLFLAIKGLTLMASTSSRMPGLATAILAVGGAVAAPTLTLLIESSMLGRGAAVFGNGCSGGQVAARALWFAWMSSALLAMLRAHASAARAVRRVRPATASEMAHVVGASALGLMDGVIGSWVSWAWLAVAVPWLTAYAPLQPWSHHGAESLAPLLCWAPAPR